MEGLLDEAAVLEETDQDTRYWLTAAEYEELLANAKKVSEASPLSDTGSAYVLLIVLK